MPIIQSAKKRVRVAKKQAIQNSRTKKAVRTSIKTLQDAIASKKGVEEAHREAQSALDTAVKKNVISKNKAARKKSQLNALAKAANGGKRKEVAKKAPAKSTAKPATKPATKKAPAKKPAAKKASPPAGGKKTAAKK